MSILQSELEIFDNLMESVSKNAVKDSSKTMLESVSLKHGKMVLDEAQIKRRKDFQKKKTNLIGKKKIVIDAKTALKGLYESMIKNAGYVSDNESKKKFFEACSTLNKVLNEMDAQAKAEIDTLEDLTKKYDEAKITPEEKNYIKTTDLELDISTAQNPDAIDTVKKKLHESNNPSHVLNPDSIISKSFKKSQIVPTLWVVGPNENEDGCFYIMKRNDGAYVLVKRYSKDRFNEHHKGDGRNDYYEPEYDSKNPTEFVQKVNNLKNSMPSVKTPTLPESPLKSSPISETDDHTWKYEGIPLNFKETEEKFASFDMDALLHVKKDLIAVIQAGEDFAKLGLPYPKLGYYNDELHVLNAEIRKRQDTKAPLKEDGVAAPTALPTPNTDPTPGRLSGQITSDDMMPFYAYKGIFGRKGALGSKKRIKGS